MKRNSLKAKILTGIVTGFIVSSASVVALAEKINNEKSISITEKSNEIVEKNNSRNHCNDDKERHKGDIKSALEGAMKDKIITTEEYDKIIKYINGKCDKKIEVNKKKDLCDDLVECKILSKEKGKDLKKYLKENMKAKVELSLNQLVKDGVIDKKQCKEIKKTLKGRKALEDLVKKGVITQEQYDKIIEKLHNHSEKCSCND